MKTIIFGIGYIFTIQLIRDTNADLADPFNVEITPREAVRRIGDELTILCRVPHPIDFCVGCIIIILLKKPETNFSTKIRMTVGTISYRLEPEDKQGNIFYAGKGLKAGECGALIKNIEKEWNGNISCVVPPPSGDIELVGTMSLLVASPPRDPILFSNPTKNIFREGDQFKARCLVPDSRPAAKITWFLGSEELHAGKKQPVVTSDETSDLQTISQRIFRTLMDEDDGKILVCRVEHEALMRPKEARKLMIVQYPPKRQDTGVINIIGLKLGAEARLNVTVRANPLPFAEWTVKDQVLKARSTQIGSGKLVTVEPLLLGHGTHGYYNISLVVQNLTEEDLKRTYYLCVYNNLGREEFTFRISTSDKPTDANTSSNFPIMVSSISASILLLILLVGIYVIHKRSQRNRRERPQQPLPGTPRQKSPNEPDLHSQFYVNMLFRAQCEQEIRAREEPQYEEIMYQ
ncbi:hypothetical protein PYW07_011307 [Mythimna separata]|uniref:Ig-like domain-containing protein n=1 Tax=Mythimna separata TaxID=271217 RepID=A0AAD7Y9D4_MYTSE|nr:hypothetical protein PYW07_011307 [Mythimna separata]